ncbi:hypothetical protein TRICHSKD4_0981 [Roseibium sp. TrichSKD4]|nr:hypothetical protein TRICHSKD4_0981 [Roseibium sp. TrichSKD4]
MSLIAKNSPSTAPLFSTQAGNSLLFPPDIQSEASAIFEARAGQSCAD